MDELSAGYKTLAFMIGSGGITTILAAYLGWRSHRTEERPAEPQQPADSMWMIQNLLEIKLEVEGIRRAQDTLTKAVTDMSVQVNTIGALLKRRNHD